MKRFLQLSLAALALISMAACSNDDDPVLPDPDKPTTTKGAFVLNQGNYGSQIEGSLSFLDFTTQTASLDLFQRANGRSLGATPQGALVYGDKIYVAVYESNVIEVINRNTIKSEKQISLSAEKGQSPRSLIAKEGKVYISMFNGYVSRLDTLSLTIDKTVEVGPNPEIMAIRGKYLYVPNSDGMNWEVGYGTTASVINLDKFEVEKTIKVPLNPGEFASNGKDLFLLAKGNYGDIMSTIYRIKDNDEAEKIVDATLMALKDNTLYYIDAPWWATEFTYGKYDITTGQNSSMLKDSGVDSPAGIGVDPISGNIVITSYSLDNGSPDYMSNGYAKVYDKDGNLLNRYEVGVGPCQIFFNLK